MAASSGTPKKILASLAVLGLAAGLAGLGSYATFTSSTSASATIASGTVAITLGSAGTADNRLTIGATGLVPGDSMQRRVKLTNASGNENLASIVLTTSASASSLLDTDATNGLQMKIERCSGTWTESAPPYTYSCSGARSDVLAERAVVGSSLALTGMVALTANNTDDMVVTLRLPTSADNTFQTLSSTVQFTFTGTQRAGTDK